MVKVLALIFMLQQEMFAVAALKVLVFAVLLLDTFKAIKTNDSSLKNDRGEKKFHLKAISPRRRRALIVLFALRTEGMIDESPTRRCFVCARHVSFFPTV